MKTASTAVSATLSALVLAGCASESQAWQPQATALAADLEHLPVVEAVPVWQHFDAAIGRPVNGAALPDGTVVINDRTILHWLRSDGSVLMRIGRDGDGPGEFRDIAAVSAGPDASIAVLDRRHARITVFDRDGALRNTHTLLSPAGYSDIARLPFHYAEGRALIWWRTGLVHSDGTPDRYLLAAMDVASGTTIAPVLDVAGGSWVSAAGMMIQRDPYGPRVLAGFLADGSVVYGDGIEYCLDVIPPQSERRSVCRAWQRDAASRKPVVVPAHSSIRDEFRAVFESKHEHQEASDRRHSLNAILVDGDGCIWSAPMLSTYDFDPMVWNSVPELRPPTTLWEVFSPSGERPVARYSIPRDVSPIAASGGMLFAIVTHSTGELGIAALQLPANHACEGGHS